MAAPPSELKQAVNDVREKLVDLRLLCRNPNTSTNIVEEEKEKRDAAVERKAKILEALERLKNAS